MKTTIAVKHALLLALCAGVSVVAAKADAISVSIGNYNKQNPLTIVVDGFNFNLLLGRAEDYQNVFSSVDDILVTVIPNGFTLAGGMGVQSGQTRFSGHAWQWVRFFLPNEHGGGGRLRAGVTDATIRLGTETVVDPKGLDHLSIFTDAFGLPPSKAYLGLSITGPTLFLLPFKKAFQTCAASASVRSPTHSAQR